jgi:uncharacterized Ntn-hydrolase superfamily protein
MTYTIVGHCERTGQFGIGVTTFNLAVGGLVGGIRPGVGVVASQAFVNLGFRSYGINLMAAGDSVDHALATMLASDPFAAYRQVLMVNRRGECAGHTGDHTRRWASHRIGKGCVAGGNALKDAGVVDAIATAFERAAGEPLAERLIKGLEAGRDAGGQLGLDGPLTERSSALIVQGIEDFPDYDLRVDIHDHAVDELRRLYNEYRPFHEFHRLRWHRPDQAPPVEKFIAQLRAQGGG